MSFKIDNFIVWGHHIDRSGRKPYYSARVIVADPYLVELIVLYHIEDPVVIAVAVPVAFLIFPYLLERQH